MNDRFKFRVWDEIRKKYWGEEEWDEKTKRYYDANYIYLGIDGKLCKYHFGNVCILDEPEQIIEQCTGLKDKNGNLIYEGDIVQYSYGRKGIVSFGKYTGCFAAGWENIDIDLFGWYLDDYYEPDECGRIRINLDNTHDSITEEDAGDFEIIGNIHEQAEQKD